MTEELKDAEREAFEAWYRKEIHDATMFRRDVKGSTRYGEYCQWFHEESWKAWQARAALAAEKVGTVREPYQYAQPGSPEFDGAEAYQAHLEAQSDKRQP